MALNYITIGLSLVIFILYLTTISFLIIIKKRLTKEAGIAFIYFIIAIIFLVIRKLQQIFIETDIVTSIPYFRDYITLIFAILFFLGAFSFYRSLKKAGGSTKGYGGISDYKRRLGKI